MKNEKDFLECYFDGACGPFNPGGQMGWGWYIKEKNEYCTNVLYHGYGGADYHIHNSNNLAEYIALVGLLEELIRKEHTDENIIIYGDSKLVILQMQGKWRIKRGKYKEQALKAQELLKGFTNVTLKWIPRHLNETADELSKTYWEERLSVDDRVFEHKVINHN